ncbi:MFS transporter [Paenarthrobacter sp. NPDC058040]|uniref:MFS transporter n=1 Tax=unclassified Paenarthrobacter TaxID=2634190 RepID=UPI0036D939EE
MTNNVSEASSSTKTVIRGSVRATAAGAIGNMLEQYDNVIYAFSAVILAKLFFPSTDPTAGLLATFAVFAAGFLARPIGAVIFGHLGDKYGRKRTLFWSVLLMAICTTAIGLMPTYSDVGVVAPALLVIIRLGQGIATAGETAGSATFIVEHAQHHRRGFLGSWQQVSSAAGFLLASLVSLSMSFLFSSEDILSWAWRLPFLLGIVTGAVALWLRFGIEETPSFGQLQKSTEVKSRRSPVLQAVLEHPAAVIKAVGVVTIWGIGYYFFLTYIPTFLKTVAGVPAQHAQLSNLIAIVVFAVAIPFFGALSDRIGRKPLLVTASVGFAVISWPMMLWLESGSLPAAYILQIATAILLAGYAGPGPAALAEMFPTHIRFSAMSIGWNVSNTLFGGTAPFIATALIAGTANNAAPAIIGIGAALISLIVVARLPETAKSELG